MNQSEIGIKEVLLEKYGPLLTMVQLAELFHRSPDGMRVTLQSQQPYVQKINEARLKVGRRVYFRTPQVADLLIQGGLL